MSLPGFFSQKPNIFQIFVFFSLFYFPVNSSFGRDQTLPFQKLYPPLSPPLVLTGAMGEYRPYSLHYGIDLSTGARSGAPVHSTAKGSVVRIMYGRYGIGYGLFIRQEDGRMAKYGHLSAFSRKILKHAFGKNRDPILKREEFNLYFKENELPVERGEVVAYSGETGAGIPHLHFELLEGNQSLEPVQAGGFQVQDDRFPIIQSVRLLPADETGWINGKNLPVQIGVEQKKITEKKGKERGLPEFYIPEGSLPRAKGNIRLEVGGYDPSGRSSRLSFYRLELLVDDRSVFRYQFDRLPHDRRIFHGGFYNLAKSTIRRSTRYMHKLYQHRSVPIPELPTTMTGIVQVDRDRMVKIQVTDLSGNVSTLTFRLHNDPDPTTGPNARIRETAPHPVRFVSQDRRFQFHIPENILLEKTRFSMFDNVPWKNPYRDRKGHYRLKEVSRVVRLDPETEDFLSPLEGLIQGKFQKNVDVYRISSSGYVSSMHSRYENGAYHFKSRRTGRFLLMEDRSPPTFLRPVILQGYPRKRIIVPVREAGMGIDLNSVVATVDGKKVLVEFDPDRSGFEIFYPHFIYKKGVHQVSIRIKDRGGNDSGLKKLKYKYK